MLHGAWGTKWHFGIGTPVQVSKPFFGVGQEFKKFRDKHPVAIGHAVIRYFRNKSLVLRKGNDIKDWKQTAVRERDMAFQPYLHIGYM